MRLCLNLLLCRRDKFDLNHFITTVSWIYLFRLLGFFKSFHRFFSFQQLFWKWTFQYGTPCILTLAWLSVVKISSWPRWWMKSVWLEQCKCLLSINHLLLLSPIMGQNYFSSSNYIWSGCFFRNTCFYVKWCKIWHRDLTEILHLLFFYTFVFKKSNFSLRMPIANQ